MLKLLELEKSAKKFDVLSSFENGQKEFKKEQLEKQKALQDQLNKVSKGAKKHQVD